MMRLIHNSLSIGVVSIVLSCLGNMANLTGILN